MIDRLIQELKMRAAILVENNKPLVIHGDGLQIRAFCHIADICQGIEKSICKGDGEIFNIGNDLEPITIENLAKKVISVLNSQSTIKYISFEKSGRNREQEIMTRIPSIQKAKKILSYGSFKLRLIVRNKCIKSEFFFSI